MLPHVLNENVGKRYLHTGTLPLQYGKEGRSVTRGAVSPYVKVSDHTEESIISINCRMAMQ